MTENTDVAAIGGGYAGFTAAKAGSNLPADAEEGVAVLRRSEDGVTL